MAWGGRKLRGNEEQSVASRDDGIRRTMTAIEYYSDRVVRQFSVMTVVWGIVAMMVGALIASQLLWPAAQFRHPLAHVQPPAAAAHQRRDLRVRRLGALRHLVLHRAAHLPCRAFRAATRSVHVLGLAGGDPLGGHHAAARHHVGQGVRGARVADRRPDCGCLGRVCRRISRHHREAARRATSTSPTGSSRRSSSRSRCCTSSTAPRSR